MNKFVKVTNKGTETSRIYKVFLGDNYIDILNEDLHFGDLWALIMSNELADARNNALTYKNLKPHGNIVLVYDKYNNFKGRFDNVRVEDDDKIIVKKIYEIDGIRETKDILELDGDHFVTKISEDFKDIIDAVGFFKNWHMSGLREDSYQVSEASEEAHAIYSVTLVEDV